MKKWLRSIVFLPFAHTSHEAFPIIWYYSLYAEYIMKNAGMEDTWAGMKIAGRNINKLRYADDTTIMAEREEERVCRGTSWVAARVWRTLWKFQRLGVVSLEMPQQKWASCRLEKRGSWIFPSFNRCSRVTMGTSGTRSGGRRKCQSSCVLLGASCDSSPVDAGA